MKENVIDSHRVLVLEAEEGYDSTKGLICVYFGQTSIQARVTLSFGKLGVEQTTRTSGIPPGDVCIFIASNIELIIAQIEELARLGEGSDYQSSSKHEENAYTI